MRTRRKGRWLLKQPRLGARMCQGTFFFIHDNRMLAERAFYCFSCHFRILFYRTVGIRVTTKLFAGSTMPSAALLSHSESFTLSGCSMQLYASSPSPVKITFFAVPAARKLPRSSSSVFSQSLWLTTLRMRSPVLSSRLTFA